MIYLGVIFLIILMSLLVSYLNKMSNKKLMPDTNGFLILRMHGALWLGWSYIHLMG